MILYWRMELRAQLETKVITNRMPIIVKLRAPIITPYFLNQLLNASKQALAGIPTSCLYYLY